MTAPGRPCTTCQHPERPEIDRRLLAGESIASVARAFQLSHDSVNRHFAKHVAASIREAAAREREQAGEQHGLDLLAELRRLHRTALGLLARAAKAGDNRTALDGVGKATKVLETMARVLGDIDDAPKVNIAVARAFIEVRQVIVGALERHPEARRDVLGALERVT